jgi:hypothetical protein
MLKTMRRWGSLVYNPLSASGRGSFGLYAASVHLANLFSSEITSKIIDLIADYSLFFSGVALGIVFNKIALHPPKKMYNCKCII